MSDNTTRRTAHNPSNFSNALDLVRSILDDQADIPSHQISPSGELYRAIERYHRGGMDSVDEFPHVRQQRRRRRPRRPRQHTASPPPSRSLETPADHQDSTANFGIGNRTTTPSPASGGSSSMSSNGDSNPRRSSNPPSSNTGQDRRHSREPSSLPPLRVSGSEPRRSLSVVSARQDDHTLQRRSAHPIHPHLRSDSARSLDEDRDRDRHRIEPPDLSRLLPYLPPAYSTSSYTESRQSYNLLPATINPALISSPVPEDYHADSRSIKRRKLDNDYIFRSQVFRYGYYGQVEPGTLKMELVSCDGGMYEGEPQYRCAADNILKDDNSVYCTKGSRCNILLRHQGATVFTLKELIIKAPGTDFDAPVRNGFVFVSMANDEMLGRTTKYQIQYKRPSREDYAQGRQHPSSQRTRPLSGPYRSNTREPSSADLVERHIRSRRLADALADPIGNVLGMYDEDMENENEYPHHHAVEDEREAQIPEEFCTEAAAFNVTTECSDDEDNDDIGRSRYRRAPTRIGSLAFESDSDDGRNALSNSYENFDDMVRWRRRERLRRNEPGETVFAGAAEFHQVALQEAARSVGGALLQPLAKFTMDRDKNKCTMRFDPPASARFLLLKMWNPTHDPAGNIDIKAIMVKGFAGPRYFPSIKPR